MVVVRSRRRSVSVSISAILGVVLASSSPLACGDSSSTNTPTPPVVYLDAGSAQPEASTLVPEDSGAPADATVPTPHGNAKVVDTSTARPDGKGSFVLGRGVPAIAGDYVVFTTLAASQLFDSIWSFNVRTGTLTKLVDYATTVPGGTGTFTAFNIGFGGGAPLVDDDMVTFVGFDSTPATPKPGIFTVSVTGGAVKAVVSPTTTLPSSGVIAEVPIASWPFSIGGGKVAFVARSGTTTGIYTANPDGTSLVRVVDSTTPFHPATQNQGNFTAPTINGATVSFYGGSAFDASNGPSSIFTCPSAGPSGTTADNSPNCQEPVAFSTPLTGDSITPSHTRVDAPFILDGDHLAFMADDANDTITNFHGIYTVSPQGGVLTPILSTKATLPGLSSISPTGLTFATSDGVTAVAAGDTNHHSGYFAITSAGTRTRIIGTTDAIDGHTLDAIGAVGPRSTSTGRVAMLLGSSADSWTGIYVANP